MHPRLAHLPDIGMYVAQFQRLKPLTLGIIDPPDRATPIGQCLTCGLTITASANATIVTCPTCGREQTASAVRLICWSAAYAAARRLRRGVRAAIAVVRVSDQPQDHHLVEDAWADRAGRR